MRTVIIKKLHRRHLTGYASDREKRKCKVYHTFPEAATRGVLSKKVFLVV